MLQKYGKITVSPADLKYAYDQYVGGAGRSVSKTVNLMLGGITGNPPPLDEYPMLSRFYRERNPDELGGGGSGSEADKLKELNANQARDRFKKSETADEILAEFPNLTPDQLRAKLVDIAKQDPQLFAKIIEKAKEDAKGLTKDDKLIQSLGVENGERASYIKGRLLELKTSEEKKAFLVDLAKKKLLTKQVIAQMAKN
jgi:hypothetical protein